jgi:hypothetical protein
MEWIVRDAIETSLLKRQWVRARPGEWCDLQVAFLGAISGDVDESTLIDRFGFSPGPQPEGTPTAVGALIVILAKPDSRTITWRASVQALADLELDAAVREQRIRYAVDRLIAHVPIR